MDTRATSPPAGAGARAGQRPAAARDRGPHRAAPGAPALGDSLERKNRELRQRNRELRTIADIASTMQTTMDVADVQERLVVSLTEGLGFPRAAVGTCDPTERYVTGWLAAADGTGSDRVTHLLAVDLEDAHDPLAAALRGERLTGLPAAELAGVGDGSLFRFFRSAPDARVVIVPVRCRGHLVGGLLTQLPAAAAAPDSETAAMLERLATHAGLALANVRLCVERTQKLTQEQERIRIASELHDVVARALFGIGYQLTGSARELPEGRLRTQLEDLAGVAQNALQQVRSAIFDLWPDELTEHMLEHELAGIAHELAPDLRLQLRIDPAFDGLEVDLRRTVFRICQEAVTNVTRHARATAVEVAVVVRPAEVTLQVDDDGVGPPEGTAGDGRRRGFGRRGMGERAEAMGGELHVSRRPAGGTRVTARLPRVACRV